MRYLVDFLETFVNNTNNVHCFMSYAPLNYKHLLNLVMVAYLEYGIDESDKNRLVKLIVDNCTNKNDPDYDSDLINNCINFVY